MRGLFKKKKYLILILLAIFVQSLTLFSVFRQSSTDTISIGNVFEPPTVFISAILRNNEPILDHWSDQVLQLADWLGHNRTYVSVYESGSQDKSAEKLNGLSESLTSKGVPHTIIVNGEQGSEEWRRIPRLAMLRNKALEPVRSALTDDGQPYQTVLFLNDIWFSWEDAVQLLQTNQGSFDAACSMDFFGEYYDMFATREIDGQWLGSGNYPYFQDKTSRRLLDQNDPVPVYSCWGGMAAFRSTPFLIDSLQFRALWPDNQEPPLDASECCLIHTDLAAIKQKYNGHARIFINPLVKVRIGEFAEHEHGACEGDFLS
ncbi:cryptococcal mannosyltransferase 1-domain-containing protein [Gongronella butleri]|nr:cryptococcal mannosyltransferase 1-domain-containing protein [Gongronella butleri]